MSPTHSERNNSPQERLLNSEISMWCWAPITSRISTSVSCKARTIFRSVRIRTPPAGSTLSGSRSNSTRGPRSSSTNSTSGFRYWASSACHLGRPSGRGCRPTPPAAQGFKPHFDTHDVFVLQISGQKHWSVYDTKVTLPLRGQVFDRDRDVPGPVTEQFELGPGSAVYIPRGLMHSARSSDEASLHITVGLTAFTWTDFLLESVAAVALQDESLRQSLPLRFTDESFPAEAKDRLVREKLETLGARLSAGDVWQHFRSELRTSNTPLFTDMLGVRRRAKTLTLTSRVRRRRGLLVELQNRSADCALCFCGQEMRFPSRMLPAVEFVTTTRCFKRSLQLGCKWRRTCGRKRRREAGCSCQRTS